MGAKLTLEGPAIARCCLGLACLLGTAAVTTSICAQTAEDGVAQASELFQRGREYEQAGNWSKALKLFRQLGELEPTPEVQYHIAFCEENLGNPVVALGGYELALAKADQVGEDFKQDVEEKVENLRATIPKLVIKRGSGAEAAKIELDGAELGQMSIGTEMPIDPGPHTVTAKAPGRKDFIATISVGETGRQTLVIRMEEAEPIEEPTGTASPADTRVVEAPDRTVPYIIGGVGTAGLLAAGVFLALRQEAFNDLEDACGPGGFHTCDLESPAQREEADKYRERITTYKTLAGVSGAVGFGALSVAAVMFLTERRPPAQAGLNLTPAAPGAEAGMSLFGRF